MPKIAIYGAKSIALGIYEAIHFLYPQFPCVGFIVSSKRGNPATLAGLKVWEIFEFRDGISSQELEDIRILIATPENLHSEIMAYLDTNGLHNYICMDSHREAELMERYFALQEKFPSLHSLSMGKRPTEICVYQTKFYKDKRLGKPCGLPDWVIPLQVGTKLSPGRLAKCFCFDNTGENISAKNGNYCELTGLYWMWKNRLQEKTETSSAQGNRKMEKDYYGLFHYRRVLDIRKEDLYRLAENKVDVILPFPMLHEPDITEHHARYIAESDWEAMLQALWELWPDYASACPGVFHQRYFYNYNLIVATRQILADYCAWLFPVLERTEQLSVPGGWERCDRYIGYLGENLMTLYFFYHKNDFNIVHTGRIMLT